MRRLSGRKQRGELGVLEVVYSCFILLIVVLLVVIAWLIWGRS